MIGIWSEYASLYLIIAGVATLLAFGLPLALVPFRWAKVFRWEIPQQGNLAEFLGRSLGAMLVVVAIFSLIAARIPAVQPFFFNFVLVTFAAMLCLHVYGAIRKVQPITETYEIILWVILLILTLCFYPRL